MDILVVAAELSPYVRETPAADAVAALCKALRQLGHEVTVALPRHPGFEAGGLLVARRLTPLLVGEGGEVTVFDAQLASGAKLVLLDAQGVFERPFVYGEGASENAENPRRFGLLARGVAALVAQRANTGRPFDLVHGHDWPGALLPFALRELEPRPPVVLTIHDGRRDGVFGAKELEALGIPRELNTPEGVKFGSKISVLKGGVAFADALTTVSPSYARELLDPEATGAVAEALRLASRDVLGISNGVDYALYNPATDPVLVSRYDAENPSNKGRSKTAALRELGLELVFERPLFLLTGPVTKERGFDVLAQALPALLKNDLALVIAGRGEGDASLEERISAAAEESRDRLAWVPAVEPGQLRRLFAAADFAVIAPRHEPSGELQLIAQRYGALPIAHAVGGLQDTVIDADAALETGTGFLFEKLTQKSVLGVVQRALAAYTSPAFPRLVRRVMRLDLAWDRPARRYAQVYRQLLAAS